MKRESIVFIGLSLRLDISGSGEIEGAVECNSLTVNISGSGKIAVTGTCQKAGLNISGSGAITYRGNPKVTFSGSGSGKPTAFD
jgi:hypothetical protein